MDYDKIDNKFKELINDIWIDYYGFVEREITRLAIISGRKIPTINDLRLHWSIIKGSSSYNWNEFIIAKVCNTVIDNNKSNDFSSSENIMCLKGSYKLKQKFSNLFYSYCENYEK